MRPRLLRGASTYSTCIPGRCCLLQRFHWQHLAATRPQVFVFGNPPAVPVGEAVTRLCLVDDEGVLQTTDLLSTPDAPTKTEAVLHIHSSAEWDRFMRFIERYAQDEPGFFLSQL